MRKKVHKRESALRISEDGCMSNKKQEWIITIEVYDEISENELEDEFYNEKDMNSYIKDDITQSIEDLGLEVTRYKAARK